MQFKFSNYGYLFVYFHFYSTYIYYSFKKLKANWKKLNELFKYNFFYPKR